MEVTRTQLKVTGGAVLLLAAAFTVKAIWFPTVAESCFELDYRNLQKAPAHVLILRPTHFPNSVRSGCMTASVRTKSGRYDANRIRLVGRNVSFADVMAMAYRSPVSSVLLPLFPPTNHFDFLVTVPNKPVERFRAAIKHQLGCTAHWEEREANVLVLKAQNSGSSGLKPSSAEAEDVSFQHGKLQFQHAPMQEIVFAIEEQFKQPVQDQTGLTGFYDFALAGQGPGRDRPTDQAFKKSLAELGLTLDTDTESRRMLVVEVVK